MLRLVGRGFGESEVGVKVIRCLGEDTSPIYGVYGAEVEGLVDFGIGEEGFHCILYVVSKWSIGDQW